IRAALQHASPGMVVVVVVGGAVVVVVVGGAVVVVATGLVVVVVGGAVVVVATGPVVVVVGGAVVVVAAGPVVVVVGGAVVVVAPPPAQPPWTQASQQLANVPTHALPPAGAWHRSALRLMLHRVLPLESVRQHVTDPFRPHAERAAQAITSSLHSAR